MRKRTLSIIGGLFAIGLAAACSDLDTIGLGRCGNGVLEQGEDCDHFDSQQTAFCIPADQPDSCRYGCGQRAGESQKCPTSFECGLDGLCRQPSGKFAPPRESGEPAGRATRIADFDGDGVGDVLTFYESHFAIVYYGGDGWPEQAMLTPFAAEQQIRPGVGDISDDKRADLTLPVSGGLLVLLGSSDRQMRHNAYLFAEVPPDYIELFSADLIPTVTELSEKGLYFPGGELMVLFDGALLWVEKLFDADYALSPTPGSNADLAGRPLVGQIKESGSPSDEIVLAYVGGKQLYVYESSPEVVSDSMTLSLSALPQVVLADDDSIAGRAFLLHVNPPSKTTPGDDHLDLVVGGQNGLYVAYGIGDGSFHSAPPTPTPPPVPDQLAAKVAPASCGKSLAVGHLDNDGLLDMVMPDGVVLSSIDNDCQDPAVPNQLAWDSANVADLNGDGLLDVVAGTSTADGLDFFIGTPSGTLNPAHILTSGKVARFAVGDFDGDLLPDVAMNEKAAGEGGRDLLSIAFGNPFGAPDPPVSIAALRGISDLAALDFSVDVSKFADGIADLAVTAKYDDTSNRRGIAILEGRGDRQLQSPFVLDFGGSGNPIAERFEPYAVAIGRMSPSPYNLGIAAIGRGITDLAEPALAVGLVSSLGDADLTLGEEGPTIASPNIKHERALMTVADFDGDDAAEVLVLAYPAGTAGPTLYAARYDLKGNVPTVTSLPVIATLDGVHVVGDANDLALPGLAPWLAAKLDNELVACNLSADAPPDLLTLLLEVDGDEPEIALYLLPGKHIAEEATGLSLADFKRFGTAANKTILGFGCLDVDAGTEDEVVIAVLDDSVLPRLVELRVLDRGATGQLVMRSDDPVAQIDSSMLPALSDPDLVSAPVRGLATGDVSGDRIDDIVIATESTMLTVLGLPAIPEPHAASMFR